MGLFGSKELEEKIQQIDVMQHQMMDLRDHISKIAQHQEKVGKDIMSVQQAISILDADIEEIRDSLKGKDRSSEQRIAVVEAAVRDLKLVGRLAIENRDEIDTMLNIIKKIAEPEFREVVIANDSQKDRFKDIEDDIRELKEREIIVEEPDAPKHKR